MPIAVLELLPVFFDAFMAMTSNNIGVIIAAFIVFTLKVVAVRLGCTLGLLHTCEQGCTFVKNIRNYPCPLRKFMRNIRIGKVMMSLNSDTQFSLAYRPLHSDG